MKKMFMMLAATFVCCAMVFAACTKGDGPDAAGKKALLIILDGWGIGDKGEDDVISQTATPYLDHLAANYPPSQLQASGEYVGLPDGQMGNSETGHLNIGAGRVAYQDLVKINHAGAGHDNHPQPAVLLYDAV
jgi:2,3-bisphosphoglycerate-independent phosphoglycerate mutase